MLKTFGLCGVLLAATPAAAAGPPAMEGRWKSDTSDVLTLDIVACGKGYCGQTVLASGCGETVLRLVPKDVTADALELEGTMHVPAGNHTYKATALFDADMANAGPILNVDGYDELPTYEHREFPFAATFARIGPATCWAVPAS